MTKKVAPIACPDPKIAAALQRIEDKFETESIARRAADQRIEDSVQWGARETGRLADHVNIQNHRLDKLESESIARRAAEKATRALIVRGLMLAGLLSGILFGLLNIAFHHTP